MKCETFLCHRQKSSRLELCLLSNTNLQALVVKIPQCHLFSPQNQCCSMICKLSVFTRPLMSNTRSNKFSTNNSVGNSLRSPGPGPITLEEGRELFVDFSSILGLWFEIHGMRTHNFLDWVSNTDQQLSLRPHNAYIIHSDCCLLSNKSFDYHDLWSVVF